MIFSFFSSGRAERKAGLLKRLLLVTVMRGRNHVKHKGSVLSCEVPTILTTHTQERRQVMCYPQNSQQL